MLLGVGKLLVSSVNALMQLYKFIVNSCKTEGKLVQYFLWHIAFLLSADSLLQLMKQPIDDLIATDHEIQQLLTWLRQKSCNVSVPYKPAVVRAFYLDLVLARIFDPIGGTLDLARALDADLTCNLARPLALDLSLDRALGLRYVLNRVVEPVHVADSVLERAITHARVVDPKLAASLQQLKSQLPRIPDERENILAWWQSEGQAWTEQLRAVTIEYRNCGYYWQFNEQQQEVLLQYYNANQLLVAYLKSMTCINSCVREEIEATLLLPIA